MRSGPASVTPSGPASAARHRSDFGPTPTVTCGSAKGMTGARMITPA